MQQKKDVAVDETDDSSLLDCYRIAIDFGIPAALKAYEKLASDSSTEIEYDNKPLIQSKSF